MDILSYQIHFTEKKKKLFFQEIVAISWQDSSDLDNVEAFHSVSKGKRLMILLLMTLT